MAARISRQITAQTNQLKEAVVRYNSLYCSSEGKLPCKINLQDAYDVQSSLWNYLQDDDHLKGNGYIPVYIKRTLIDLKHRVDRSNEEISLIKEDMINVLHFYQKKRQHLMSTIAVQKTSTTYDKGVKSLLLLKKQEVDNKLKGLCKAFKESAGVVVEVPANTVEVEVIESVHSSSHVVASDSSSAAGVVVEVPANTVELEDMESVHSSSHVVASDSSSGSDFSDDEQTCQDEDAADDYDPLEELYNLVSNSYEGPLSSAESDID